MGLETHPLERTNLADTIVSNIRQQIATGVLAPGSRLPPEVELAKLYGVGRNTVREAIKALCLIRLLNRSNRGTYVSDDAPLYATNDLVKTLYIGDDGDLSELFEARAILVSEIVQLACVRATTGDIAAIERAIAQMDKASGDADMLQADLDYHHALAEAAHNSPMCHFYLLTNEALARAFKSLVHFYSAEPELVLAAKQVHRLVLDAIQAGDSAAARRSARESIRESAKAYSRMNKAARRSGKDPS
jgi:DNA-binding FadR family transcriptional regulator